MKTNTVARDQNSILTTAQREYLHGETELSSDAERMQRKRIRERVSHGIADLALLADSLEAEDWDQIFADFEAYSEKNQRLVEYAEDDEKPIGASSSISIEEQQQGKWLTNELYGAATFLTRALDEYGGGKDRIEEFLEEAIERIETTERERAEAEVTIEIERSKRLEGLLDKITTGETVTPEDVETLVENNETNVVTAVINAAADERSEIEDSDIS